MWEFVKVMGMIFVAFIIIFMVIDFVRPKDE